jgi:hypothetical protein
MAGFSYVQWYGDGATDTYTLTFPYLYKEHVSATVNNIFAIMQWVDDNTVRIVPPPANGALLTISRSSSPGTKLVTYNSGSVLTDSDLNLAHTQDFYLVQEALDALPRYTEDGFLTLTPDQAQTIKNQLVQDILNSALLAELQTNLTEVDNLAEAALQDYRRADIVYDTLREQRVSIEGASASILEEQALRVSADEALAATMTTLTASLGTTNANLSTELITRATADSALSASITTLNASLGTTNANLTTEQVARANADSAIAVDITTLNANLGTTNANVTTETAARVSGDSALSTSISSVSTTVGGHTTTIASQATSINGLNAQYTMKIDANGYLAGFGLAVYPNNDGGHTSQFIILADQFAIVTPGKAPRVPFVVGVINGVSAVGVSGQLIVDGSIFGYSVAANTITANKLLVNTLSSITADIGYLTTGTIRMGTPTGNRMELTDQDAYRIWYGTGTKNDTNGVFYIKNDGTAKFAGNLSAAGGTFSGNLSAAGGTFAGSLSAATGSFSGSLSAATGTFSGTLTASAINAVNTLNVAGHAITYPVIAYTEGSFTTSAGMTWHLAQTLTTLSTATTTIVWTNFTHNTTVGMQWQLRRNGTVIATCVGSSSYAGMLEDAAPAGTNTYDLYVMGFGTGNGFVVGNRTIIAYESKR